MENKDPQINFKETGDMDNDLSQLLNKKEKAPWNLDKYVSVCRKIIIFSIIASLISALMLIFFGSIFKIYFIIFFAGPLLSFVLFFLPVFVLVYAGLLVARRKKIYKIDVIVLSFSLILVIGSLYFFIFENPDSKKDHGEEELYNYVGSIFNIPEFCEKIPSDIEGSKVSSLKGYEIESLRSGCFKEIAVYFNRPELCREVKSISNFFANGSKINEEFCLSELKRGGDSYGDKGILYVESVIGLFKKLGYSDDEIGLNIDYNDFNHLKTILRDKISEDNGNSIRNEFIKKVDKFIKSNSQKNFDFGDILVYLNIGREEIKEIIKELELKQEVEENKVKDEMISKGIWCTDTDGGFNPSISGKIYYLHSNKKDLKRIIDSCEGENFVYECFCDSYGSHDSRKVKCPKGCKGGACIK